MANLIQLDIDNTPVTALLQRLAAKVTDVQPACRRSPTLIAT